jgi:4,5-dihydroxyphthalate decarboxylase
MMKLPLSLAIGPYDHTRELRPEGIELTRLDLPIEEIFFRFTKFREWDVSEMSFGKIISLMSEERPPIVALPVFVSRVFRHSAIYVADAKKIRAPKDLEGKRVGIPEWAQTAGIYVRGMLQHEYGVDLARIDWRQAGVREAGRVEKVELRLPPGVKIQAMPQHTLSGMLANGELDAAISARDPGGTRLFANHRELEAEYFRKTGIFPIMHVVVVRREAYERDRWIAMNLFKAFEQAKELALERIADIGASQVPVAWIADHAQQWRALAGPDLWPYGLQPNRRTLEAFVQYGYEQGVSRRQLKPEELFAPETLERAKI